VAVQFNATNKTDDPIFEKEIECAIRWLFKIQDKDKYGWGWVQHIPPNEQNTAEAICALLSNYPRLSRESRLNLYTAINNYLINPGRHARITIDWVWVLRGLQFFKENLEGFNNISPEGIDNKINLSKQSCIKWLIENQNNDGGWADVKGDLSSVTRTSLAIIVLSKEKGTMASKIELTEVIEKATRWLIKTQNTDGGWGNVRQHDISSQYNLKESKDTVTCDSLNEIPYENIECQYLSNAACTGYSTLALNSVSFSKYRRNIKKAIEYIKKEQQTNGGWPVFCEVGLREGIKFTFRHFSTAWALNAMLETDLCDYSDECVLDGVEYLLSLQDQIYGGWKSSSDSDSYTWSTCNALELLSKVQVRLKEIKADNFLYIVKEWWKLKTEKNVHTWRVANIAFTFNTQGWFLFCVTYTLLLLTWDILLIMNTENIFFIFKDNSVILKVIKAFQGFALAILVGIPWVTLLKHTFKKEMTWLSSISWVYGIISGILIAFYGFIIN
jgi:hypothetical protein